MTRPRGNKTSNAARERRHNTVVDVLTENPSIRQADLADATGVSLTTVKRDLAALRDRFSLITDEKYAEFKKAQLAVFELIERNLVEGSVTPEVAREWRGIRSEISQLLGLNAPSKHISARVDAPNREDMKWRDACAGLDVGQLAEVYRFAKSLPRHLEEQVRGPEWFPAPMKKLTDGSHE